jgi:hypothetical protein
MIAVCPRNLSAEGNDGQSEREYVNMPCGWAGASAKTWLQEEQDEHGKWEGNRKVPLPLSLSVLI